MKKTIVFDIDDTIAKMRYYVAEQASKQLNRIIVPEDITSVAVEEAFPDVCWDTIQDHLVTTKGLLHLAPEDTAVHTLKTVKDMGYNISIVTARGYHPNAYNETVEWFIKHDLPFDDIHCVNHNESKNTIIKDLGHVELYVDDHSGHIKNAISLSNVLIPVLINRPWNLDFYHRDIHRVNEIHEILEHLE